VVREDRSRGGTYDIGLDAGHAILVDMDVGDIPIPTDSALERLQPTRLGRLICTGTRRTETINPYARQLKEKTQDHSRHMEGLKSKDPF
jgi:hypothetical protein